MKTWPIVVAVAVLATAAAAQTPYRPTEQQLAQGFEMANSLGARGRGAVLNLRVETHWLSGDRVWYRQEEANGKSAYLAVDTRSGATTPLFDESKLSGLLTKQGLPTYEPGKIPIGRLQASGDGHDILLRVAGKTYLYEQTAGTLVTTDQKFAEAAPAAADDSSQYSTSTGENAPDGNASARIGSNGNVSVKVGSGPWKTVTHEGSFAFLNWAGDSRHLLAWYVIPGDRKVLYLLHATGENKTRATLETRRYDQPGDKLDTYIPYVIDVQAGTEKKVDAPPMMNGAYPWPSAPGTRWWNGGFLIDYPIRGYQEYKVDWIDPNAATIRNVIDEKSDTFVNLGKIFLQPIPGTTDLLWNSERDGWDRLYRIDGTTGQVLNAVTPTHGVFRSLQWLDSKNGELYVMGNDFDDCTSKGQNPYLLHLYRVGLDGKGWVDLTPQNGTHTVAFSPDHRCFIDTYSWVNEAPVTSLVRTSDGHVVKELAKADISKLLSKGIRLPIPFNAKARDGKTDIWGIACLPTNFNPKLKYPVIENIYAGPQDSFVPTSFYPVLRMSELAELGFIVVQIDGMGTDNRGKAFHDVCWHNIVDAGFPDRILWMQALAKKMPQLDLSRVGVYGTSAGGQDAVNAVLHHADFYKVAVASCGCYDNRIDKQWWNEQWMGYPLGPWYAEQSCDTNAAKLKGHLMIMVAEDDHNVPPESAIRLDDALIKAGKDFDFMIFPGSDHTDGGVFGERKRRDFFVQWLFGMNPPNWNSPPAKN